MVAFRDGDSDRKFGRLMTLCLVLLQYKLYDVFSLHILETRQMMIDYLLHY